MPSGYTQELCEKDISFERFIWQCARAFGAFIEMRDDGLSATIPKDFLKLDPYHLKRIEEDKHQLLYIENLTIEQAEGRAQTQYEKSLKDYKEEIRSTKIVADRLNKMKEQVTRWLPPSPNHEGLKKFMLDQLNETLKYDGTVYGRAPEKIDGNTWKLNEIEAIKDSIRYHTQEHEKVLERNKESRQWISLLHKSIPCPAKISDII